MLFFCVLIVVVAFLVDVFVVVVVFDFLFSFPSLQPCLLLLVRSDLLLI